MEYVENTSEVIELIKKHLKERKVTVREFALSLGKNPSSISRTLHSKHDIPAETLFSFFKHMGYEVVLMNKKEKNLLEKEAYAELSKGMTHLREEIREDVIAEIESELMKTISAFFHEHPGKKAGKK
jgi:transcriptional regulator with XRE-family HTH domain